MMRTLITAATLLATLSGCASISYSRYVAEELGLRDNPLRKPGVISYLETLPLAQLMLTPEGRGGTLFVLAEREGRRELWVDAGGARIYSQAGVLEGSAGVLGLSERLEEWAFETGDSPLSPLYGAWSEAPLTFVRWVERVQGSASEQRVTLFRETMDVLDVLSRQVAARRYTEQIKDERGHRWRNQYWVLENSGYVIKSRVRPLHERGWVTLEVTKMPRLDEAAATPGPLNVELQ